ncbi:MAG: hypothetical protein EOP82_12420 [Variovorax sp.]|nr:MAG: hypothetical protein EOP82_12420 [Variovorax sp.]
MAADTFDAFMCIDGCLLYGRRGLEVLTGGSDCGSMRGLLLRIGMKPPLALVVSRKAGLLFPIDRFKRAATWTTDSLHDP